MRLHSNHDSDAVRLDDYFGRTTGFLDKKTAHVVSSLIDKRIVEKVEAKVSQSPLRGDSSVSLRVFMSGFENRKQVVNNQVVHCHSFFFTVLYGGRK